MDHEIQARDRLTDGQQNLSNRVPFPLRTGPQKADAIDISHQSEFA